MRTILTVATLFCAASLFADEVTQFRGTGSGASSEKNLPLTWSATENVRWKAELPGRGLSNPVTAGGRVFLTAASGASQNRLHVVCLDQKSGKQLWERQFWATGGTQCHPKTNMAAPTPVTDGRFIYALFATADLVCLDLDGKLEWARSLVGDHPTVGNNVGMAASPVLAGDVVVIHMENAGESFAVGIDRATGRNRWQIDRPRVINWNTPLVHREDNKTQVVLMTPGGVTAHDPATGAELWAHTQGRFATSASMLAGDGLIFIPGDKLTALKLTAGGPEIVWQNGKLNPGYASPVYYQGRIYTVSNRGVVSAADAKTGVILWTHRVEGVFSASPLAADGRLYLASEEGVVYVMEAGAAAKLLATNELHDTFLASPVAANGAIYLRSDKHLWCIRK